MQRIQKTVDKVQYEYYYVYIANKRQQKGERKLKKIEITEKLEAIFKEVSNKTLKALEKEKGNHISKKTEKMIALCLTLSNYVENF